MAKAQKEWARRKRRELVEMLGGVCAFCGAEEGVEFDCIVPMGDRHHKYDTSQRMCFYRKQFRQGNLQLLCHECNARKGDERPVLLLSTPLAEEPF